MSERAYQYLCIQIAGVIGPGQVFALHDESVFLLKAVDPCSIKTELESKYATSIQ